jgi:hypothetical protein
MVVLAAAVLAKGGKRKDCFGNKPCSCLGSRLLRPSSCFPCSVPWLFAALVSRQYMDMSRIRIEGLLAAFPKLVGSGKQHTYVETENVRYIYQPMEVRSLKSSVLGQTGASCYSAPDRSDVD